MSVGDEAEAIKRALEDLGAEVEVQSSEGTGTIRVYSSDDDKHAAGSSTEINAAIVEAITEEADEPSFWKACENAGLMRPDDDERDASLRE